MSAAATASSAREAGAVEVQTSGLPLQVTAAASGSPDSKRARTGGTSSPPKPQRPPPSAAAGAETWPVGGRLVMDIGASFGQSSERYLASGQRVVAVEPNPVAARAIRQRLRQHLESGALRLEEKAVWIAGAAKPRVTLYVNEEDSEWSSVIQSCGERFDTEARAVEVESTTLEELFQLHGTPWYLKLDTEGSDGVILQQLSKLDAKPIFLSFELNSLSYLGEAHAQGYDSFKVVGQASHKAEHLLDEHGRPLTHAGDFGEAAVGIAGNGGWQDRGETLELCRRLCLVHDAEADVQSFAEGPPRYVDRDFATLRACFPVESRNDEEWYDVHCRHGMATSAG